MSNKRVSPRIVLIMLFLFLLSPVSAGALQLIKGSALTGDITLAYEKSWGDVREQDQFIHQYHLVFKGFAVDPRLATFELNSFFNQYLYNPGTSIETYGFGAYISLLNSRVLRGPLQYFPQPIRLRFDYSDSNDSKSYHYGLSLYYNRPEKKVAFFQNGKIISFSHGLPPAAQTLNSANTEDAEDNGNNGSKIRQQGGIIIPFPSLSLDYDSYNYKNDETSTDRKTDNLDFRATTLLKDSEYRLEYRYLRLNNESFDTKYQWLEARADYHFSDMKTARTLDIYNRYYYYSDDSSSLTDISSRGFWQRRFGLNQQDAYSISGQANYVTSNAGRGFAGNVVNSYTKSFSERFRNTVSVILGYTKFDEEPGTLAFREDTVPYTVGIQDSIFYRLSPTVTLTNDLGAAIEDNDMSYSFGLGLLTDARVSTTTYYLYTHSGYADDERDTHAIQFSARTMLTRNAFLISNNSYQMSDSRNGGKQKLLNVRGDIYWLLAPYRLQLSAYYQSEEYEGGTASERSRTVLQAQIQRSFRNRLTLITRVLYAKYNSGLSMFEFDPQLNWAFRRVFLTARYTMRKFENDNGDSGVDHRFYFTLRRDFDNLLRPFF